MKIFMVLILFCGPILAQEKTEIPTGNPSSSVLTVPRTRSLGPVIEIIELGLNNTVGEAIEIVRQADLKEDRFFAFSVSLQKHELTAPFEGSMTLKKVPAFVALYYICDSCRLDYVYEGGMWRIHPASREEGQDERQMLIRDITEAEYKALGLRFEKEKLVTDDGKKWPTGELEWGEQVEDRLIIRTLPEKTENLKALLKLHRAGYPTPKINSRRNK